MKVRTGIGKYKGANTSVSIHAPVKVRTVGASRLVTLKPVSIHAPVKVRTALVSHTGIRLRFNPRTREGANGLSKTFLGEQSGFNPRTREGANLSSFKTNTSVSVSIHAPVKVRTKDGLKGVLERIVSIHAPVKVRTNILVATPSLSAVSIHAPVKVRTIVCSIAPDCFAVSIHAPVKVRTLILAALFLESCFNPRTREGANKSFMQT